VPAGGARCGAHVRQYNEPHTRVCVVLDSTEGATDESYEIVMRPKADKPLYKVSHLHWLHDSHMPPAALPRPGPPSWLAYQAPAATRSRAHGRRTQG